MVHCPGLVAHSELVVVSLEVAVGLEGLVAAGVVREGEVAAVGVEKEEVGSLAVAMVAVATD